MGADPGAGANSFSLIIASQRQAADGLVGWKIKKQHLFLRMRQHAKIFRCKN